MKKFFTILCVLVFVFISIFTVKQTQTKIVSTNPSTSGYAQILTNDCFLLQDTSNTEKKLFLLEQSYFVKVIEDFNNVFYRVNYLDFEGFVEKSKIKFVEEYPEIPFLCGITFDIYSLGNVCLRSSPKKLDDDSNILCTVPANTKNLLYYGKISGEEAIDGLGNVWYYSAYQDDLGNVYKGYVYSPLTNNLSSIASSDENLTYVNISSFVPVDNLLYLNLSTKNILIVITAIPTFFVVILFALPNKFKNNDT